MKYLLRILPIPERAWVKMLIGSLWIGEASLETYLFYTLSPTYLQQIIGPVDITVFISTYFAVFIGAIHLGLGISQFVQWFKRWRGYLE
ncbi:MAG: hypothetical protein E6L04_02500 [Thaumarchaeota archaeon]|nr:MAG: hypothetical protein E6L04_02500 [Nitrososphaerota archaeon]